MGSKQATRILLLKNYQLTSPVDHAMTESFRSNITASIPDAQLDICRVADGEAIPDPSAYELVILSGGRVNLLEEDQPEWVLDVLGMIRQIAGGSSRTKLLGICWGHQAVHVALGGKLAWLGDEHRVSLLRTSTENMQWGIWSIDHGGADWCTRDRARSRGAEVLPSR